MSDEDIQKIVDGIKPLEKGGRYLLFIRKGAMSQQSLSMLSGALMHFGLPVLVITCAPEDASLYKLQEPEKPI